MDLPSWLYNSESFENCIFPERIKEFPSTNSEEDTVDTLEICSTWKVYSFPVELIDYLYFTDTSVLYKFPEYLKTGKNIEYISRCNQFCLSSVYRIFVTLNSDLLIQNLSDVLISHTHSMILIAAISNLTQFKIFLKDESFIESDLFRIVCRIGDLEKLKVLCEYSDLKDPIFICDTILNFNKDCVDYMLENDFEIDERFLISSIKSKSLKCVEYSYNIVLRKNIKIKEDILTYCAQYSNEEALNFFLQLGYNKCCSFNKFAIKNFIEYCDNYKYEDLKTALSTKDLRIINIVFNSFDKKLTFDQENELYLEVIDDINLVKYLYYKDFNFYQTIIEECNSLESLQFFHNNGCKLTEKCFKALNYDIYKYLVENNCPVPQNIYAKISFNDELFDLFYNNNIPLNEHLLLSCIFDFEKFKYYREKYNAPWNDNVIEQVIIQKNTVVLSYMLSSGISIKLRHYISFCEKHKSFCCKTLLERYLN